MSISMDLIFQSLSLLLFILFATSTYFLFNHKNYSNSKNLPPGSAGWPIIGETIEFLYETPENFINHRTKKYSSQVFMTNIFRRPTAIFSGPAGSKFISSNDQKLLKVWYPPSQRSLFQMNRPNPTPTPTPSPSQPSPATQPQPKTLTSASGFLRPEARYVAKFDSFTKSFLRSYLEAKQEVVEVYPFAKTFTLTLACNYFMGLEDSERAENLVGKFDDLAMGIHSMDLNFPGTIFHRASKAAAELRKELGIFIEEKRVKMSSNNGVVKEDLLSQLIAGNQSGRKFTPPEKIVETMLGLLTASYSSAATVITFMVKHIGERPDIYQKILSEQSEIWSTREGSDEEIGWEHIYRMKYTWAVACETMRLVAPLQGAFREAITDFTFAGFTIPKGCKIYWAVNMTNKNPEYFPDPKRFDPSRFEGEHGGSHPPYSFIPFGGGPRMCTGRDYARLVILTFIHNLVNKFKCQVLYPSEKILSSLMMPTPAQGLPVRLHPLP